MNRQLLLQLVLLFALTQCLGLFVGNYLVQNDIRATIVNDNPDAVENGVGLIVWILLFTGLLLLVIKLVSDRNLFFLLKGLEAMAIFGSGLIVLLPLGIDDLVSFSLAIALVAARIVWKEHLLLRNISSIVAAAGAGALIGASIGVVPILVFLLLMAIYDFIAVFKTGHMVTLAKSLTKKNLSFTFAMPTTKAATEKDKTGDGPWRGKAGRRPPSPPLREGGEGHQFELGTGDMVVPLAFAVSVLAASQKTIPMPYSILPAVAVLIASLMGLVFTVHQASQKEGRALPALPVQAVLMAIVFGLMRLAGIL